MLLAQGLGAVAFDGGSDRTWAERVVADTVQVAGIQKKPPPLIQYSVSLTPDQATSLSQPISLVKGSGTATVLVSTASNTIHYTLSVQKLSSAQASSFLHGFGVRGISAKNLYPLPSGNPKSGVIVYPQHNEWGILAGLTYFSIPTVNNPKGEIRGQVDRGVIRPANAERWESYGNMHR